MNDSDIVYLNSMAHVLAIALHRRYNDTIVVMFDDINTCLHCYTCDQDGNFWDIKGCSPRHKIEEQVSRNYFSLGFYPDEAAFRKRHIPLDYKDYNQADIDQAWLACQKNGLARDSGIA